MIGVFDEKEEFDVNDYETYVKVVPRSELMRIQEELVTLV